MKVYAVVRKDDPERKPIKTASGRFTFDHKSGAQSFLRYLAKDNWRKNYAAIMASHEIVTYELVEVKQP